MHTTSSCVYRRVWIAVVVHEAENGAGMRCIQPAHRLLLSRSDDMTYVNFELILRLVIGNILTWD
jgi:hypothetical protein